MQAKVTSSQGPIPIKVTTEALTKPNLPTKKQVDYLTEAILENLGQMVNESAQVTIAHQRQKIIILEKKADFQHK